MAPADEIAKFRGKYKIGWDELRQQRHARQIELGIVDKAWALSPRPPEVKAWDSLAPSRTGPLRSHHGDLRRRRRTHGHGRRPAGRALRQRGELDNTLLFFLSDNGANAESGPNGRLEGDPARRDRLDGLRRPVVGDALEHAAAALQAFQPRRRHRHAADRPLARADQDARRTPLRSRAIWST